MSFALDGNPTGAIPGISAEEAERKRRIERAAPELRFALLDLISRYVVLFDTYVRPTYHPSSRPSDDLELSLHDARKAIARAEGR